MKRILLTTLLAAGLSNASAQVLHTANQKVDEVFQIAAKTLYHNVKDSLIHAGGGYGGEWTRDISINAWNAANLLIPETTRFSLWSVTTDHRTFIGHQYWDQIIWVTGAYDHYLATGDRAFLRQAYQASRNSMEKLEKEVFDTSYGLFTGPSVFNDGIAGYEEPIYQSDIDDSFVGAYPNHKYIKCLSTNCIYYQAYKILAQMAQELNETAVIPAYLEKAKNLKAKIREHLWDAQHHHLNYLIDQNGKVHTHQEGLGNAFAILFGVVSQEEAKELVDQVYVSPYGLPSIYPCFQRFSKEKPGRHNVMVWPFVNAFWAEAALRSDRADKFVFELENLTDLVLSSEKCFYEIYNCYNGKVSGGWQSGNGKQEWDSIEDQTWSATGYLRMIFKGMLGLEFTPQGLRVAPHGYLMKHLGFISLDDLRYQQGKLQINRLGSGSTIREIRINEVKAGTESALICAPHQGKTIVDIVMCN